MSFIKRLFISEAMERSIYRLATAQPAVEQDETRMRMKAEMAAAKGRRESVQEAAPQYAPLASRRGNEPRIGSS
jgi:hypothetical protein